MFSAPAADAEVPDLKYKDKKDLEKQVNMILKLLSFLTLDEVGYVCLWSCWGSFYQGTHATAG